MGEQVCGDKNCGVIDCEELRVEWALRNRRRGNGSSSTANNNNVSFSEDVKSKVENFRKELKELIDERSETLLQELTTEGTETEDTTDPLMGSAIRRTHDKQDLFRSAHIKTIYNFFLAILVLLIVNSFISDYLDTGKVNLTFDLIWWCFGKMPIVITLWVGMFFSTIIVLYPGFSFWAHIPTPPGLFDSVFWIIVYGVYVSLLLYLPNYYMRLHELPIASSIIVACEQIRLFMKVHAFVRENIPIALKYKAEQLQNSEECRPCPVFENFLYFLFVPTLIYRDEYPRTKKTDWEFVASNFAQVLGSLFYTYYVLCRFCVPVFHNFNREHITPKTFVLATFSSILPGGLCLLLLFWTLLHAWMNAFAEMLRFGDRMFYKDWWNSTTWAGYYRTWNAIVHDWLYAYIYRDVNLIVRSPSRASAAVTVFFLSSVVHEYVVICAFRFFYPVLFFLFAFFGGFFFFITRSIRLHRAWNVMMWFNLMIGNGVLMALYSMEWTIFWMSLCRDHGLVRLIPQK